MSIVLKCTANCDDVLLNWRVSGSPDGFITDCLGYAIEIDDGSGKIEALHNLKGFEKDAPQTGQTQDSTIWPFQTYSWTDHSILVGEKVRFQVTAMVGTPGNLARGDSSGWSDWMALSPKAGNTTSAFFNRGMILSQFVSRYAKQNNLTTMKDLKSALKNDVTGPLMQFLSGELGKAIRGILQEAQANPKIELYCALFELDLDDLIGGLATIGKRAHVILANGSVKSAGDDENSSAAASLEGKVDLHRRMSAPAGLAHNKFVVVCVDGKPMGVWTGSTNWTMTGLHTQINNGISVWDEGLANIYFDQWNAIVAAGDHFTPALKTGNAQAHGPVTMGGEEKSRVWFTPVAANPKPSSGGADIDDLVALVNGAKEGILFIMFMPGSEPLDTILKRQEDDGLYVRGVVSTLPKGTKDNPSATYQIMTGKGYKEYTLDVVQPSGVSAVGDFLSTFSRQDFLGGMGFAITHSKVLVIDPFGSHPVVVTGSHNMSAAASGKNDENLLIIENCPELAQAYAVNCMSVYKHYRWPAYQQETKSGAKTQGKADSGFLNTSDSWQSKCQDADTRADMKFWM